MNKNFQQSPTDHDKKIGTNTTSVETELVITPSIEQVNTHEDAQEYHENDQQSFGTENIPHGMKRHGT